MNPPLDANSVVEGHLSDQLGQIAAIFGTPKDVDALCWYGPVAFGTDTVIKRIVEERRKIDQSKHLVILLTTEGGIVEVVQRVVPTIRYHYDNVTFVIPDYAYSAGTVLALSGDDIFMDYHSRLGPIDPQVLRGDRYVPALGYVERYDDLIKKAGTAGGATDAEIAVLVGSFNQAELYEFEQARELSITLLRDWLVEYKFKNWNKTATRGVPVTIQMKKLRARKIARALNATAKWHSHGAGISAQVLRDELKLVIADLDASPLLKVAVMTYQALLEDFRAKLGFDGVIHMQNQFSPYHVHG